MTLTSYRYKLQFVYDIINGKQSIADARKIFSDEWAAFYGLYVNISTAEQKLMELDTFMHRMNAYNVQMIQFFETRALEIYKELRSFLWQSCDGQEDYEEDYEEYYEEDYEKDDGEESLPIPTLYYNKELISRIERDISGKCIAHLAIHSDPEDVQMVRDVYFRHLNHMERNPYIRSIKRNAFNEFLKKWNYI